MELAFGASVPDLAIVFVVALLIFGPKRLPEVGRQVGLMLRELRKVTSEFTEVFHETHSDIRDTVTITDPPQKPFGTTYALDQDHEEGLMARSPLLGAPEDALEAEERTEPATGLVVST